MEIIPLGDSALIVRLRGDFGTESEGAARIVAAATDRLASASIPGVVECAPAYNSVAVFLDRRALGNLRAVEQRIAAVLRDSSDASGAEEKQTTIEIPVCYDTAFAEDLDVVATHTGLSAADVVRLHANAEYRVACIGFMPGFPYLTGLPKELATPRRVTPRKQVPAGAVAIGGAQTGIYPAASPGGWNIIGRTPVRLFDAQREPPSLLRAGDRVRFRSISREEFERAAAEIRE